MNSIHDSRYQRLIEELVGARKDAGFTQEQAAGALKWRRTLLSNIETCQRRADVLDVYAMAKLYGVSFHTLEAILTGDVK